MGVVGTDQHRQSADRLRRMDPAALAHRIRGDLDWTTIEVTP